MKLRLITLLSNLRLVKIHGGKVIDLTGLGGRTLLREVTSGGKHRQTSAPSLAEEP